MLPCSGPSGVHRPKHNGGPPQAQSSGDDYSCVDNGDFNDRRSRFFYSYELMNSSFDESAILVLKTLHGQSTADDAPIPASVVISNDIGSDTVLTDVFPHTVNNGDWQAPLPYGVVFETTLPLFQPLPAMAFASWIRLTH